MFDTNIEIFISNGFVYDYSLTVQYASINLYKNVLCIYIHIPPSVSHSQLTKSEQQPYIYDGAVLLPHTVGIL